MEKDGEDQSERSDRVKNEVILLGGKEERKILHKIKRKEG